MSAREPQVPVRRDLLGLSLGSSILVIALVRRKAERTLEIADQDSAHGVLEMLALRPHREARVVRLRFERIALPGSRCDALLATIRSTEREIRVQVFAELEIETRGDRSIVAALARGFVE